MKDEYPLGALGIQTGSILSIITSFAFVVAEIQGNTVRSWPEMIFMAFVPIIIGLGILGVEAIYKQEFSKETK